MRTFERGWATYLLVSCMAIFASACGKSSSGDVLTSHSPQATTQTPNYSYSNEIFIDNYYNGSSLEYNRYGETEFYLSGNYYGSVYWNVLADSLPAGMYLNNTNYNRVVLSGTPQFQGEWCFTLGASTQARDGRYIQTGKEVCVYAQDSYGYNGGGYNGGYYGNTQYPKFSSNRYLRDADQNRRYNETILVDSSTVSNRYYGTMTEGRLPYGISLSSNSYRYEFTLSGNTSEIGTFRFVLRLDDSRTGQVTYKQFQLSVNGYNSGYSCPPGYYYDSRNGYCTTNGNNGVSCPSGMYYEPSVGGCVSYQPPPTNTYCGTGYYYDHYLNRCEKLNNPRCPTGYKWSDYENRCVQDSVSCPTGYTYNWTKRVCERVHNNNSCSNGYYWDSYLNRCVKTPSNCPDGHVYDPQYDACVEGNRLNGRVR